MAGVAAPRRWNGLPADLAYSIAGRLPCPVDRFHMSRMCSTWTKGVRRLKIHPPLLPWLLLPYHRVADNPRRRRRRRQRQRIRLGRFFCVHCNLTHRAPVPLNTGGVRFFGAYQGGWVFIAYGQHRYHALINLHPPHRRALHLPDVMLWNDRETPMSILAATLSAPPVPGNNCVAAAIVVTIPVEFPKLITIWPMGSPRPTFYMELALEDDDVDDVIYHKDAFYFINQQDTVLLVCTPDFTEEAPLEPLQVHWEERRFHTVEVDLVDGQHLYVKTRYLVESRGELLMVVRLCSDHLETSSFRVFRMTPLPDAAHAIYSWTELPALDGRMLFVERGCSRSYEVVDFPGSDEGVYFHDECFYDNEVEMICKDAGQDREYPCSDNGACWELPDDVETVLTTLAPSTYSSPVWFLH